MSYSLLLTQNLTSIILALKLCIIISIFLYILPTYKHIIGTYSLYIYMYANALWVVQYMNFDFDLFKRWKCFWICDMIFNYLINLNLLGMI